MNSYEQKQADRRDRIEQAADRATSESAAAFNGARDAVVGIPFGQPILVGHHSERRHRAALERHDSRMRRAIEADKRSAELARRAAAVGSGGISSDDPDAVVKLIAEIEAIKARRDRQKTINAAWRKAGKPRPVAADASDEAITTNTHAWRKVATVAGVAYEDLHKIRASMARDFIAREPFPAYETSNSGANVRRIEKRIAELRAKATRNVPDPIACEGFTVTFDDADNRIAFEFDRKPVAWVLAILRSHGWKWSPTRGCHVRMWNASAEAVAGYLIPLITAGPKLISGADSDTQSEIRSAARSVLGYGELTIREDDGEALIALADGPTFAIVYSPIGWTFDPIESLVTMERP